MNTFLLHGFKLSRDSEYKINMSGTSIEQDLESLALLNAMAEGCSSLAATVLLGNCPSKEDVSPVMNAAAMLSGLVDEAIEIISNEALLPSEVK